MYGMVCRKLNLVVVDDDRTTVRLVTKVIEGAVGNLVDVHPFTDSREANDWIQNNGCDVLLSDIEMPGLAGLEMLRRTKSRNAWTQVVFMTAPSSWDRIVEAVEAGASNFLVKPLDQIEMVELLKHEYARFARWQTALLESAAARA